MTPIITWLRFALQQMATESYLDRVESGELLLPQSLQLGNNNLFGDLFSDPVLPGNTRMTIQQVAEFISNYQIVDHHASDATGFSATLMKDRTTGEYTLSFRSLEYQNQTNGGDWERDGIPGAAGEVSFTGFALGQLVSMERYYRELKADPNKLPAGAVLNVTGYSLGGHLATIFTELHHDDSAVAFGHTYTFNGAGRGGITGGTTSLSETERIREMLSAAESKLLAINSSWFASGNPANVYQDEEYKQVRRDIVRGFSTTNSIVPPGIIANGPAFEKITQIVGHADGGVDAEVVANSGIHAAPVTVLVETQPLYEGRDLQGQLQFGNSHSITLLIDSLALQELFLNVDPTLTQSRIEDIFRAVSSQTASVSKVPGVTPLAEGDTLEKALDVLRKVFLGDVPDTPFGRQPGDFGNLAFRNQFYQNIEQVDAALMGGIYRIDSLVGQSPDSIAAMAQQDDPNDATGIAYRYALKELNPFAVRGINRDTSQALYGRYDTTNELALLNPDTGVGELTPQYLKDRAAFLVEKIRVNSNPVVLPSLTHFKDVQSDYEIGSAAAPLPQVLFGDATDETLAGSLTFEDHLYGGKGEDRLYSGGGNDYLEGNQDNDLLDGGSGADIMLGGTGNDTYIVDNTGDVVREYANGGIDDVRSSVTFTLDSQVENLTLTGASSIHGIGNEIGNIITGNGAKNVLNGGGGQDHLIGNGGNDILLGGTGDNDLLEGGEGFDTYIYHPGDGLDRIEDSDAKGQIIFDQQLLQGGIRRAGDAPNTFVSLDGKTTYVMANTDLVVNGQLIVNENFQSGQMGIQLRDLSSLPTGAVAPPAYEGSFLGDSQDNYVSDGLVPLSKDVLHGFEGRDILEAGNGDDALYGEAGDDLLLDWSIGTPTPWNDLLDGGTGNDYLGAGLGDDVLRGGDGNDILLGGRFNEVMDVSGRDHLDGGAGSDYLWGSMADDVLLGGDDDDILRGDNLPGDVPTYEFIPGGYRLTSPPTPTALVVSATGGVDYLDGGSGDDLLVGDGGDDVLIGGAGDDTLYGESDFTQTVPGNDWLEGGDGADRLFGGAGADLLSGGDGDDLLIGDFSNDPGDADILDGGAGADELQGGGGDDILYGGTGMDRLAGFTGDDILDGGAESDELQGGAGADSLWGGSGDDVLAGQEGDDSLFGDQGDDLLLGDVGNDTLAGGDGGDGLFGQDGDDLLAGDAGDDVLNGGLGNDRLDGGDGIDDLQGREGDDLVVGGAGNDFLYGDGNDPGALELTGGNDTLDGEEGDDLLYGGAGQDQLFGGDGADQLSGAAGNDVLFGEAGHDLLLGDSPLWPGQEGVDTLDGGEGNDRLEGGGAADVLEGGDGDDVLFGGFGSLPTAASGDDDLHGGAGNDDLVGGDGRDTYHFNLGDGIDTIVDTAGEGNRLIFGAGITPDRVTLGLGLNDTLIVRAGTVGDEVWITNFRTNDMAAPHPVETFEFADGTVLTHAQLGARGFDLRGTVGNDLIAGTNYHDVMTGGLGTDVLSGQGGDDELRGDEGDDHLLGGDGADALDGGVGNDQLAGEEGDDRLVGNAGDDFLTGGVGQDVLSGGEGNDALLGGSGGDTYLLNLGDGVDTIGDVPTIGETNRLVLGNGIVSQGLKLQVQDGQLRLPVGESGDAVIFGVDLNDVMGSFPIAQVEFADGTTLLAAELVGRGIDAVGTGGDDSVIGTNLADQVIGGTGDDLLQGGAGHDSYRFNIGDGRDRIDDQARAGEGNEVLFGSGITPDMLSLELSPAPLSSNQHDLVLHVGNGRDALVLGTFEPTDALGPRTVESFRFSDGTVLTNEELVARGIAQFGTVADDRLIGTNVVDRMEAGEGDDSIQTGAGEDVLEGGPGKDRLQGGSDSDVYLFGAGSGQDTIVDMQGPLDTIRFSAGIAPTDVAVARRGNDLVFTLSNGVDQLTVANYFLSPTLRIERVEFEGGTVWDRTVFGIGEGRTISGTTQDDVLTGMEGGDVLDGGLGADRMIGAGGDDTYLIDNVGDLVIEDLGGGQDTVLSSVSHALSSQVENLTLVGSAAINGIGNELDNILTGSTGANVLLGGAGNDTYVVGAGDSIVEELGQGNDTVVTDENYRLDDNVENLTLTGSGAVTGIGNELDNVLTGNGSASLLAGGGGNDTYMINGLEVVKEAADEGVDTVLSTRSYRLGEHVENLTLVDSEFGNLWTPYDVPLLEATGNALNNVLVGSSGQNVIDGGEGADILDGRGGTDTLIGGPGVDTYLFGRGYGADLVVDFLAGETDIVQMDADLSPSDVIVLNPYESDLVLQIASTSDALTLARFFSDSQRQGKEVRFADGTVWNASTLESLAQGLSQIGDTFNGTNGNETLTGSIYNDRLSGFGGDDTIVGSSGDDQLFGYSQGGPLTGETNATDRDRLEGGAGNDVLWGGIGDDVLDGGTGNDQLVGGAGRDTFMFEWGWGQDSISYYDFAHLNDNDVEMVDTVQFGSTIQPSDLVAFRDGLSLVLQATGTADRLTIHPSGLTGSFPIEAVRFADGTSWSLTTLHQMADRSAILGTSFADYLSDDTASIANETLDGLSGDDTLVSWSGHDTLIGRDGDDLYVLEGASRTVTIQEMSGEGRDTVRSNDNFLLPENVEDLQLTGSAYAGTGNALANRLTGTDRDNVLDGGAGNDTLIGGYLRESEGGAAFGETGSDILIGGAGDDVLIPVGGILDEFGAVRPIGEQAVASPGDLLLGGTGNDLYVLHHAGATVIETAGEGNDTVWSSVTYALPEQVENLTLITAGAEVPTDGIGNDVDNILIGSKSVNVLYGLGGNDTLMGGWDASTTEPFSESSLDDRVVDTLIGGAGDDTYVLLGTSFRSGQPDLILESEHEGTDLVLASMSYTLGDHVENLTLRGEQAIDARGNGLNNVLIGNAASNELIGGAGNDRLAGGSGDDTYIFNLGDGIDTIADVSQAGEGNRIRFGAGITRQDLTVRQSQHTLTIEVGSAGDAILLSDFDPSRVHGSLVVQTLEFNDGSVVPVSEFLVPAGSAVNDVLTFGSGPDVINALGGDDQVDAGAGNDVIAGGAGNDVLRGGAGNDVYLYNLGDGIDAITDLAVAGEGNELHLGSDIAPIDLSLGLGSLLIRVGSTGGAVHLTTFNPADVYGAHDIELFRFADGTVLSYAELLERGFDISGTSEADVLMGTNIHDRIMGLQGDDTIEAGDGDDVLDGGLGADDLAGGLGNDVYVVEDLGDIVNEQANAGTDTVQSYVTYTLGANVENLGLMGTADLDGVGNPESNRLIGNEGNNRLDGGAGADTMGGGAGNDTYIVDQSGDVVTEEANSGIDTVESSVTFTLGANLENLTLTDTSAINGTGNELDNILLGNGANNTLAGGAGDDRLDGGLGNDTMLGGTGNDIYIVDNGGDVVTEQANEGTDTVQSGVSYTLGGNLEILTLMGSGNLTGTGNSVNNELIGNAGNNVLDGGAGADTMIGRAGDDTYRVDDSGDVVSEAANEGLDSVQSTVTYQLGANVEHLTLTGTAAINGTGNELNNTLIGNGVANVLDGAAGNDTLLGGAGNDTLQGGTGDDRLDGGGGIDTLLGGLGNDIYLVDNTSDTITEALSEGVDTVESSVTFTLGGNLENLTLAGTAATNGTGNALDNVLLGNSANNTLTGGAGNDRLDGVLGSDTLIGGMGDDVYVVNQLGDVVIESANQGIDTVESAINYTLSANLENLTLTGTNNLNGTGNGFNNVLVGNAGANALDGGSGNDTIDGGAGNDSLQGGSGDDHLLGGLGDDTLNAGSGNDVLKGGDGNDSLDAGSGDDQLFGGEGTDLLTGGSGADQFTGGTGNDTLRGGSGNDLYNFLRGDGQDTIIDQDQFSGNSDTLLFGTTIDPLDLVLSRQANDLRISLHGTSDQVTIHNWCGGAPNQVETLQAGNGKMLLNTQVSQLIQAMASFTQQTGLSWEQAIDQRPQDVQQILAANWQ